MKNKDNFNVGHCELCGTKNIRLINSHYLPSFFYAKMNDIKDKYHTLNLIQSDWTKRNMGDHQITKNMLCKYCEELLSKFGETQFPNIALPINQRNPDLFVKLIRNLLPKTQHNLALSNIDNFDNDSLYYFIISMFWRSSLNWSVNQYDKRTLQCVYPRKFIDEMKLYLQTKTPPLSFKILVIPLLKAPYYSCSLPKESNLKGGGRYYSFNVYQYLFVLINHNLAEEKVEGLKNGKIAYCISEYFEYNFAHQFNRSYEESKTKGKRSLVVSWIDQKFTYGWSFAGSLQPLYFIPGNYLIKECNISWTRNNTSSH